jgi:hypothetical protein
VGEEELHGRVGRWGRVLGGNCSGPWFGLDLTLCIGGTRGIRGRRLDGEDVLAEIEFVEPYCSDVV